MAKAARKNVERVENNLVLRDARIIFRNFRGEGSKFNREGNRNFCAIIDDEILARRLKGDGWNVRELKPMDEDDDPRYYIQITVAYNYNPPKIYRHQGGRTVRITEKTVDELDHDDIISCDIEARPYNWNVNGKTGVKAYLKTMHVNVEEDVFADKYGNYDEPEDDLIAEDDIPF